MAKKKPSKKIVAKPAPKKKKTTKSAAVAVAKKGKKPAAKAPRAVAAKAVVAKAGAGSAKSKSKPRVPEKSNGSVPLNGSTSTPIEGVTPRIAAAAAAKAANPKVNGHTKPLPSAVPPRAAVTEAPAADEPAFKVLTEDDLKKINSGLTKKDLEYFRELLLERRAEILGDYQGMQEARNSGGGETSHMPLHMADVGSDHYEQEFTLGLMESERRLLKEIDEALYRIQRGYYGVCVESGKPIPRERLEITPWAKYCIEVARDRERRGLPTT